MTALPRKTRRQPSRGAPKALRKSHRRLPDKGATQHEVDLEPDSPIIREQERCERRRRGFKYAAWLVIAIIVGTVGWMVVKHTFIENPKFGLREVAVNTRGLLTPRKIVRVLGLTEGTSVLTLNIHHLAEKLRRLPEVSDARITREMDGRLIIDVTQREPVAWVQSATMNLAPMKSGFGCLLDAEGHAIPCEVILDEHERLPVIQYDALNSLEPGCRCADFQLQSALKLLAELERRCEEGPDTVKRIEVPNPWSLVAHFEDGTAVSFGPGALDFQLARYDRVKLQARQNDWQIATLDLLPIDNAPITFHRKPDLAAVRAVPAATPVALHSTR